MYVYTEKEKERDRERGGEGKRQRRRLKDTKMRREAWRWAARETKRWVSDGEGRKVRKSGERREEEKGTEGVRSRERETETPE